MTANTAVRRFTERAMELHRLTPKALSRAVGCNDKSIYNILNEQPVKLNQEQYFNLFALAGVITCTK